MTFRLTACAVLMPLLFATACGGKSDETEKNAVVTPSSSYEGKEESCASFCELAADCSDVTTEDCVADCTSNKSTSAAGQDVINQCFESIDCSDTMDQSSFLGALVCLPAELQDLDLSDTQKKYCQESVPKILECTQSTPADSPFSDCEATIGLVSDEQLEDMIRCADKECDKVESCLSIELLPLLTDFLLAADDPTAALTPEGIANLLTVAVIAGPWASEDTGGFDLGGFLGPDGMPDSSGGGTGTIGGTAGAAGN